MNDSRLETAVPILGLGKFEKDLWFLIKCAED